MAAAATNGDIQTSAKSIIVFHPGSQNLRFGRASDPRPHMILHALARRRKKPDPKNTTPIPTKFQDEDTKYNNTNVFLKPPSKVSPVPPEVECARLQLSHTIQTALRDDVTGLMGKRNVTPPSQIAAVNKRCQPMLMPSKYEKFWEPFKGKNMIIGEDIYRISPDSEDFDIHFPWRRGSFNLHKGIGGSMHSVMNNIEHIWRWCIVEKLGIPVKEIKNYRAIAIIPVMFDRAFAKEILNLLLCSLGFGHAAILHDHVCAAFATGVPYATVVDVGHEKISVSCVEDGISIPASRIEMKYGGGDLAIALHTLTTQSCVPFKVKLNNLWDLEFLRHLKERFCHFDLKKCKPEERSIIWDKPGGRPIQYNMLFGDELLIVPLSYFNPDLLRCSITCKPVVVYKQTHASLSDDPFDPIYIMETSRRVCKDVDADADQHRGPDHCGRNGTGSSNKRRRPDWDRLLGIDQAILQSIESLGGGDDLKRRLLSHVIVVGCGFKFRGLATWLRNRIFQIFPRTSKYDHPELFTHPRDCEPGMATWKGAIILFSLETAQELWIKQTDWVTFGSRLLREKCVCQF